MGSKAAVVMFVERDPREVLLRDLVLDHSKSKSLAETILGSSADEVGMLRFDRAIWPSAGIACAASLPGLDVVCSRELARSRPSQLTEEISRMAAGRDAYGVFMQSTEDWTAFAVWSAGRVVRALSLSPDTGVIEDLGERLPFEAPFWGGEYSVDHDPDYPLPFHPSELGNEALKTFFGFILEGSVDATCFDPEEVEIPAFRAAGQDRAEPQFRELVRREILKGSWADKLGTLQDRPVAGRVESDHSVSEGSVDDNPFR